MEQPTCERCEFVVNSRPIAVHTRRTTRSGVFKRGMYVAKIIIAFLMSLLQVDISIGEGLTGKTCAICMRRVPVSMVKCKNCHLLAHEKCILQGPCSIHFATVDAGTQTDEISSARAHVAGQTQRNPSVDISAEPTSQRQVPAVEATVEDPVSTTQPQTNDLSYINAWDKRLALFSRFDHGIMLDKASFRYSCPEFLAAHIAEKCTDHSRILDPFCGVGSIAIQLALLGHKVIAIDRNPKKIIMAKKNADIYGVSRNISFRVGDCYKIAENIKADAIVTSPPWGTRVQDARELSTFLQLARKVTTRVILNVQNNTINHGQCLKFAHREQFNRIKIEKVYIDKHLNYFTFYLIHDTDVRDGGPAARSPIKNEIKFNTRRLFDCVQVPFWDAMASYRRYLRTVTRFLDQNQIRY